MNSLKNVVLKREFEELLGSAINIDRGNVGGYSIEVEIKTPLSYDSFLYQGKTAEQDREHDFLIIEKLFKVKNGDLV